ncbi:MAG: hypothetical protein IT377_14860 [Polyangiaceae bacterium]|nr:hypothetical protein [Polyangiaceae bacterium]
MSDRVLFVADQLADAPRGGAVKHPGGAELTDAAALAACPFPVEARRFDDLDLAELSRFDIIVLGNTERASSAQLDALARTDRVVSFEHDVRICRWRGNFPAAREPVHALAQRCICPHRGLHRLYRRLRGVVYLTGRQRRVFEQNPYFGPPPSVVLGSSLFDAAALDRLESLSAVREARQGALYLWAPHAIKGTEVAREYCRRHGLAAEAIRNVPPAEVHALMGRAETFVYLPIGLEPAGRMPVEARLAGCHVVVNSSVGVAGEAWWRGDRARALEQLSGAPRRFWQLVEELMARPQSPTPEARPSRAVEGLMALARRTSGVLPELPVTPAIRKKALATETFDRW